MGLNFPIVATLLLFLVLVVTCSGYTTYYVKPTPDTTCPAEPCLTLSEYAQQPHNYLTSNTTLLLLHGVHVLSVNFTVENVCSFEICAQLFSHTHNHPKSRVLCEGSVGFTFRNVSTMVLNSLTFISCCKDAVGYGPVPDQLTVYGMSIYSGEDIMIVNCSFEDSVGTALGVFYSSMHLHGNSFTNKCNGHSSRTHERWGTGIFTNNNTLLNLVIYGGGITSMNSTLKFTGNTAFRNNSAKYGGGIYSYNSTLNIKGNIIFEENSAEYGGGIDALNSILNFSGSSSFIDNTAEHNGGGINVQNSTLIATGNSKFWENSVWYFGGGINAADPLVCKIVRRKG